MATRRNNAIYFGNVNLPNQLTILRFFLTFVFIGLLSYEHVFTYGAGLLTFIIATITDYYDGKIARERNLITNFGKLMDPVADKVLIISAFIMLMLMKKDLCIPAWTVAVVIGREFLVTGARSLAASEGAVIGANRWGKTKAVFQMVYVYCFLGFVVLKSLAAWLGMSADHPLMVYGSQFIRYASLWGAIAVALYTVYSGIQFARINWDALSLGDS